MARRKRTWLDPPARSPTKKKHKHEKNKRKMQKILQKQKLASIQSDVSDNTNTNICATEEVPPGFYKPPPTATDFATPVVSATASQLPLSKDEAGS